MLKAVHGPLKAVPVPGAHRGVTSTGLLPAQAQLQHMSGVALGFDPSPKGESVWGGRGASLTPRFLGSDFRDALS